jgi:hypothetical protein
MKTFIRNLLTGYEPALARSIVLAVFVLLGAFGLGSGNLPPQAEAVLTFLAFIMPIAAGWLIRRKVTPVTALDAELPADDYPEGYEAAVLADDDHEAVHPPLVYEDDRPQPSFPDGA